MKVINMFAGPGCGKSTTAAGLFSLMKMEDYNVELVTEYAKELVWAERHKMFADQTYLLAKQNHRLDRLRDKGVDYVITDSPLIIGLAYTPDDYFPSYRGLVIEMFNSYDNINFFLTRTKKFNPIGRNQKTVEEAIVFDEKIRDLMDETIGGYYRLDGDEKAPVRILQLIKCEPTQKDLSSDPLQWDAEEELQSSK